MFTGICCLCAFTMLAIYTRIYIIARKHSKQIAQIHSMLNKTQNNQENKTKIDPESEIVVISPSNLILNLNW